MSNDISFKLEGGKELQRWLETADIAVEKLLSEAVDAGARILEEEAQLRAPGPEIGRKLRKKSKHFAEIAVGPSKEKWYYQFFETGATAHEIAPKNVRALLIGGTEFAANAVGTGGVSARPFLRPAIDTKQKNIFEAIGQVLMAAMKGAGK